MSDTPGEVTTMGDDLVNPVQVTPDRKFVMDSRLRVGGVKYLERLHQKPFTVLCDDLVNAQSLSLMSDFCVALLWQKNPDVPIEELVAYVDQMEIEEIGEAVGSLTIMELEAKNSRRPKSRPKRKVKKKSRKKRTKKQ